MIRAKLMVDRVEKGSAGSSGEGFERLLEETMKRSMADLLGESSMKAIFFHINMENPARDPEMFHQKLYGVLKEPALVVEEIIVKDLFKRLDVLYTPKGAFEFKQYVSSARDLYATKAKTAMGDPKDAGD
jgi:hypothetical protein